MPVTPLIVRLSCNVLPFFKVTVWPALTAFLPAFNVSLAAGFVVFVGVVVFPASFFFKPASALRILLYWFSKSNLPMISFLSIVLSSNVEKPVFSVVVPSFL